MARKFGNIQKPEHAGEVRQSQLISTFGVGSIVDFVRDTVIIAGVDNWDDDSWERRRLFNNNLQVITGAQYFLAPKTAKNTQYRKSDDVESFIFPRKLYCPVCKHIIDASELRNQQKKHNCFMPNRAKPDKPCGGHLVASRFVIVCPNGHIEDFPYSWWAHNGEKCDKSDNPRITMNNFDNRSDLDSLFVRCEDCGANRGMASAFLINAFAGENGYKCNGKHPHLGKDFVSECAETMTTRLRSSAGIYFPATLSALTIPPWSRKAVQLVEAEYEELADREQYGEKAINDYIERKILPRAQRPITFADLVSAYRLVKEQKISLTMSSEKDIYASEYNVLCGGDSNENEYVASKASVPAGFERIFETMTIIDKLTVIEASVGFTRIKPWDGSIASNQLAPLSRNKKNWLPAVKLLGEGIFFKFRHEILDEWERLAGDRYSAMARELFNSPFRNDRFSPRYVVMHTFAHLLIRQLSNDCGYNASSIKEKIYSTYNIEESDKTDMRGVLIYIAASDSEGSLGGLISIARAPKRIQEVLKNMLHQAMWCSADPLCGTSTRQGFCSLNYAACHDCVLLPETSCEFRNALLDRVSIVGTPENPGFGLMSDIALSFIKSD